MTRNAQRHWVRPLCQSVVVGVIGVLLPVSAFAQGADPIKPLPERLASSAENQTPSTWTAAPEIQMQWAVLVQDKTLYQTMRRWVASAGYQLMWEADRDFPIEANITFSGNFEEAVTEILQSLQTTDYPLQALINPRNKLVRIVRFLENSRS